MRALTSCINACPVKALNLDFGESARSVEGEHSIYFAKMMKFLMVTVSMLINIFLNLLKNILLKILILMLRRSHEVDILFSLKVESCLLIRLQRVDYSIMVATAYQASVGRDV